MEASLATPSSELKSTLVTPPLKAQDLYQHDPLLVLFRDRLRLNTVASTIILIAVVLAFSVGVLFGLATLSGTHFDLDADFGNTFRTLLQTLLQPTFAAIYLLLPNPIAKLFNTLYSHGVIGAYRHSDSSAMSYERFLQKFVSWIDSGWWSVMAVLIVVLFWVYRLLVIEPQLKDHSQMWVRVAILALYSPLLYCILLSLVRLIITLVFTNWLFHAFTIKINPLHPDGYAGLGVLGSMLIISATLTVTSGVMGLVMNSTFLLGNESIYSRTEAIFLGLGYLILAPTLLLGWIALPHQVMQDARNAVLQPLAEEFQTALIDTRPAMTGDANSIKASTDHLAQLKRRYELIQNTYPTWPVAIENVRRLGATISLPALIPILLPVLTSLLVYLSHLLSMVTK